MSAKLAPSDKLLGQVLAERYHVLQRLGEGAMGVVYKARHVKVGRMFAVKVLHPRMLQDAKIVLRFEREAELAGRLRHPNVIGVVDVGEVDGTRYMVMDFAEGPDLAKLLDEAPMTPERIIRLVRAMLEGLYHAHEQGLIHRDFKPENVIIERDSHGAEVPRIVDFGIALLRDGGDSYDGTGRLTTNGLVLGTPHYMAPEQAVADPIDHRIDLFALGIVIYEMLSGRLPFDGSGAEVARANLLIDPPPIRERVKHLEVDPLLEAFARRLMAKKRTARPATAKAARELLDLIERDRAAAAVQLGVPVARSGRAAPTESVAELDDPTDVMDVSGPTVRMQPTPRPVAPVAVPHPLTTGPSQAVRRSRPDDPVVPGAAWFEPEHAAAPLSSGVPDSALDPAPSVPPMVYAVPVAPPAGGYGPSHRAPHRDTALRTPMGWQTASLPGRRRSWLIAGAVVGVLSIVTAAVLTLTRDREPSSPAHAVSSDPAVAAPGAGAAAPSPAAPTTAAATAPAATVPAQAPTPPAPTPPDPTPPAASAATAPAASGPAATAPAATAPAPTPPTATAPAATAATAPADAHPPVPDARVRDPRGDVRRPSVAPIRPRGKSLEPVSRPDRDAAGTDPAPRRTPRAPEVRDPDVASPDRPEAAAHERSETAGHEGPASAAGGAGGRAPRGSDDPPTGTSPAALGELFEAVKAEIEQLPEASRQELLNQLTMLNIMRAMTESQQARDDAAAHLRRLRQRMHDRKTGH